MLYSNCTYSNFRVYELLLASSHAEGRIVKVAAVGQTDLNQTIMIFLIVKAMISRMYSSRFKKKKVRKQTAPRFPFICYIYTAQNPENKNEHPKHQSHRAYMYTNACLFRASVKGHFETA